MTKFYLFLSALVLWLFISASCCASDYTDVEKEAIMAEGVVDIATIDSVVAVHVVYSMLYDFMEIVLYCGVNHVLIHSDAAATLVIAAEKAKKNSPRSIKRMRYAQLWCGNQNEEDYQVIRTI